MIFTKHRFEIWNQAQHPFKHSLSDFAYSNPAMPGVTNVELALGWLVAVLYPNTKAAVADVASLPLVGNTLNDFRVVQDDGDGKAAAYRWEQREGEVSASWHKIYDMDWGQDSILAAFQNNTQDLYVWKDGRTQLDEDGAAITGLYAGQTVYGGDTANQNLTFRANSGDGVGAHTGYVQSDDNFRPTVHDTFDLGTNTERWKNIYAQSSAVIGTLSIVSGSITDSSGAISFGNENLSTTGNVTGAVIKGTTSLVAEVLGQSVTLVPGLLTDTTGSFSFGSSNVSTLGTLGAGVTTLTTGIETLVFTPDNGANQASIITTLPEIFFGTADLFTNGGAITGGQFNADSLYVANLLLSGNTIQSQNLNGNVNLLANGTGIINLQSSVTSLGISATGTVSVVGQLNADNLRFDGNTISSTDTNGNIVLTPNGSGYILANADIHALTGVNLGTALDPFDSLFITNQISNGTLSMDFSTLMSFRSGVWRDLAQTQPAQAGDTLFWDSVNSVWLASHPDAEILHSEVTGLTSGDAGHTQFTMLAGRSGGQVVQGGTAASENLVLESTSHATKGNVLSKDSFLPFSTASYSGSWAGIDLGSGANYFRDIYTKGELKGARLENFTSGSLPSASAQNIGRVVFATDNSKAYVDVGTQFKVLGVSKFVSDLSFDGIITVLDTDISADISDARNAIWQLKDNANNFEILNVTILATSATNVRVSTSVPLLVGSYRLIGLE